jgi:hypothetical protein
VGYVPLRVLLFDALIVCAVETILSDIQMSVPFHFQPYVYEYTIKTSSKVVTVATSAFNGLDCYFGIVGPISCNWEDQITVPGSLAILAYVASDSPAVTAQYFLQFVH